MGGLAGFAAHSDQTACWLINRVAALKAVCCCNPCFANKAPENVFAYRWETRVIHELVGELAYAIALVWAVVQRAEEGFLLQRFESVLVWPRYIAKSRLKGRC